ncbi:MAG: hypothetical protein EPO24_12025 [Bacteroidetes bacterium]|nr:MAG: hypothetical protein EPO24_12025 [Bacteroidota bacterium]
MKVLSRILSIWLTIILLFVSGILLFSHKELTLSSSISLLSQSLLMVLSFFLIRFQPKSNNKYVFLNFFLFFSLSLIAYIHFFVGKSLFVESKYANHYFFQYYTAAFVFTLALSIVYLVINTILLHLKVFHKYLVALSICLLFFGWYFYPIIKDPLFLYNTEDIHQWKTLATYVDNIQRIPDAEEMAKSVTLQSWDNNKAVGDLYAGENLRRIEELLPYLEGENYRTLLTQPLFSSIINLEVMMIAFILLYFGYQYKKEPPQGAYMDKIIFTLLLFISTDILHYWGYMKSVEWSSLTEFFTIGQYISNVILVVLVVLFSLRLKFVLSPQGEYYETELDTNPGGISRWRDAIDDLILMKFFKAKTVQGRLFQKSTNN